MHVLKLLAGAGFMINVRKCKFLVSRLTVVGQEVEEQCYRPIEKPIQKLFGAQPPQTYKQL